MTQTQENKDPSSATERAEELLDRFGRNLGLFVASTGKRVQQVATVRRKSGPAESPGETGESGAPSEGEQQASARAEESDQESMERADAMVGQVEQRVRSFATLASFNVQRTTARLREEVEDMWAEAQHLRQQSHHQP